MRDEEREQQEGIKIVDKRRFTEEGELRSHSSGEVPLQKDELHKPSRNTTEVTDVTGQQTYSGRETPVGQSTHILPEADFSSFIVSLATQALILMGEIPNPESNERSVHLEAAKQTIDIISIVEQKTRGNLTKDEERLIGEVLASLRMTFVKRKGTT